MRYQLARVVCLLSGFALVADLAHGADESTWQVGQRVMPKLGCKLKVGEAESEDNKNGLPYQIRKIDGSRLVVGDRVKGTLDPSDVVPLAEAPAYYGECIRRQPDSAWLRLMRGIARVNREPWTSPSTI